MKPLNRFPVRMALAVMISTLFVSTALAEEGWLVDFEKAKTQAAKEGKPRSFSTVFNSMLYLRKAYVTN